MSWEAVYALQAVMVGLGLLALTYALTMPTLLCLAAVVVLYVLYRRLRKEAAGTLPMQGKTVLITGCDTGFGNGLARDLHQNGCRVIATVFRPDGKGAQDLRDVNSDRLTVLPLDVSSDESVAQCLRHVRTMCQDSGLWGLVNNAGHNFTGWMELTTMKQYLMVGNINIYGMVRTTRAFLPLLRQAKGRIVNVTSIKGLLSTPLNAAYNITKFAGETFSEITRMETKPFGIKVSIIEPGNFGGITGCLNKDGIARMRKEYEEMWEEASDEVKDVFSHETLEKIIQSLPAYALESYPTLTPVVEAMKDALFSGDPELRYIVDGSNRLLDPYCTLVRLKPFLPDRIFDHVLGYVFPCNDVK